METILFNIFFWGVFVGGGTVFVIFCSVMAVKQYKRDMAKQKATKFNKDTVSVEPEFTTITRKVTVVDQTCCVKTIGIKTPKTIKEFTVVFQTETGEILTLNIPEEMYDGFEKGQSGILSVVDGELYSFELEEADTAV